MAIPLTVAVVLLGLLVILLAVVVLRQSRQIVVLTRHYEQRIDRMTAAFHSENARLSGELQSQAKWMVEHSVDSTRIVDQVALAVGQMTKSVADGMRSVYAPMQASEESAGNAASGDPGPIPYRDSPDYSDPTDFFGGVQADGNDYSGPVIADDDVEPFGIAGLGIDPAIPPRS